MKNDRPRQLKVFLSVPEHNRLRIAAALRGTSMSVFGRETVLAEADHVMRNLPLPQDEAQAKNATRGGEKCGP